jgi:hypothetical protein
MMEEPLPSSTTAVRMEQNDFMRCAAKTTYFHFFSGHIPQINSNLSLFGLTKRLPIRVNRMAALNIQMQHVAQVACAFLSAAFPLNVIKSFRNGGINVVVDVDTLSVECWG